MFWHPCVCVLNKPAAAAKKPQKANWNGRLGPGAVTQLCVSGSKIHLHYTYTYMDVYYTYTFEGTYIYVEIAGGSHTFVLGQDTYEMCIYINLYYTYTYISILPHMENIQQCLL